MRILLLGLKSRIQTFLIAMLWQNPMSERKQIGACYSYIEMQKRKFEGQKKGNNSTIKFLGILFILLHVHLLSFATINVSVNIQVNDSVAIEKCDLCVSDTSKIVYFAKLSAKHVDFLLQQKGSYSFFLTKGQEIIINQTFFIEKDTTLTLEQTAKSVNLHEVVVVGQQHPKTTATGQIFRLSDKAKKSGDPFKALSEIPLLNVDISGQSVKTNEGDSPLVLIDGKFVNSGIAPIDPKFIDSVEIVEVVNAKYLQMGVSKIINIHLKRNVPLYTFVDLRTRHDIPIREGFGAVNFELGTSKFAASGSISGDYLHSDKVTSVISETSGDNNRDLDFNNVKRSLGYDGQLLLKWTPKPTEYFAGVIKKRMSYNRGRGNGQGYYNDSDYHNEQRNKFDEGGWLGAIYYEHSLKDDSRISAFAKYNRGNSSDENSRNDVYSIESDSESITFLEYEKTLRSQYELTIDYTGAEHAYGSIFGGNDLEYTHDTKFDHTVTPIEKAIVNLVSNYSYMSYSKMWKRLFVMGSIGLQYMHIQAENESNSWWRPRAVASIGLKLQKSQTVRLTYNLDNELPHSSQLSTFSHSTNPWLRVQGNPFLLPMEKNDVSLTYDKSFKKFTTRLFTKYQHYGNMIEQFISNEGEYSIQSYRNNGTWRNMRIGGIFTFRSKNFRATVKTSYRQEKYYQEKSKGAIELGGNLKWDFGKFFIYSDISWQSKSYTAISETKYLNPSSAHVQMAWQATKQLYISAGLPYFWGVKTETSNINRGNYSYYTRKKYNSASLRPWILISWTIRKNVSQSIEDRMPN